MSPTPPLISALRPVRNRPDRVAIFVGRRKVATLRAAHAEELDASVGVAWTPALAQRAAVFTARLAARDSAVALLNRRALSRAELVDRLVAKGHPRGAAEHAAAELASTGALDDAALAERLLAAATARRPAGRTLLESSLERRRIAPAAATPALDAALRAADPRADAAALVRARFGGTPPAQLPAARRRAYALLLRRGYDEDTATHAIESALGAAEPDADA